MPPKAKGAKKKNGYQMPEKFDDGFSLKDIFKTNWTLGKPIGQGGFGLIYLANKGDAKVKNPDSAEYVVKIEPKDNGPLFCETHFYINCAKDDEIKSFIRTKSLSHLAVPKYISSGLCTYNDKEYRFLVMDRYVRDIQSVLDQSPTHQINEMGVMCLMRQILYCLEYIHQKGYAHGDVKGANVMVRNDQEAYLVDYGLACRFKRDNLHQKYEIKPERKHNGTIEYTSRDAHCGAQINRRSDLEILGYCVIHWLSGTLPWIDLIKNCEQVQQSKIKHMNNCKEFVKNSLANNSDAVKSFMEYFLTEVNKLEYDSEPSYSKIHLKLTDTLRAVGHTSSEDNFYIFKPAKSSKAVKPSVNDSEDELEKSARKGGAKSRKRIADTTTEEDVLIVEEEVAAVTAKKSARSTKKEKGEPSPAPSGARTPAARSKKAVSKKEKDDFSRELSDIDADDDDDLMPLAKNKNAKKPTANLQSTAIDQTQIEHFKDRLKRVVDEDSAAKRSPKKIPNPIEIAKASAAAAAATPTTSKSKENGVSSDLTPRRAQRNQINYNEDQSDSESNSRKRIQQASGSRPTDCLSKDLINTPTRYETRSPTPRTKSPLTHQMDCIGKFKQANHIVATPKSPLALANLDRKNTCVLVKKRKNVPKTTIATQTDESYLLTHGFSWD